MKSSLFIILLSSLFTLFSCSHTQTKHSPNLTIIGTAHKKHVNSKSYNVAHFKILLAAVQPDLVLLEVDPKQLSQQDTSEFLPEMLALLHYAKAQDIPVRGFDSPSTSFTEDETNVPQPILQKRAQINALAGDYSFAKLNGEAMTQALSELKSLEIQHWGDDYPKARREQTMAQQVLDILQQTKAQRVFLFTGFKHLAEFKQRLSSEVQLQGSLKYEDIFSSLPTSVDSEVQTIWKQNAELLQKKVDNSKNLPPARQNLLKRKLALLRSFL